MNKTTEALKLCVEALPNILFAATERDKKNRIRGFDGAIEQAREALTAVREALNHSGGTNEMVAEPVCKRCNGTKLVYDGEIDNIGGADLEVPIECVKDCPDCAQPIKQEPVATKQLPDPYDDRDGVWFDVEGLQRLKALPAGTKLYAAPVQPVNQEEK